MRSICVVRCLAGVEQGVWAWGSRWRVMCGASCPVPRDRMARFVALPSPAPLSLLTRFFTNVLVRVPVYFLTEVECHQMSL